MSVREEQAGKQDNIKQIAGSKAAQVFVHFRNRKNTLLFFVPNVTWRWLGEGLWERLKEKGLIATRKNIINPNVESLFFETISAFGENEFNIDTTRRYIPVNPWADLESGLTSLTHPQIGFARSHTHLWWR